MSHCGVTQKKPKPMKYLKDTFGEVENCHSLANKNNQNAGAAGDLAQQLDEVML